MTPTRILRLPTLALKSDVKAAVEIDEVVMMAEWLLQNFSTKGEDNQPLQYVGLEPGINRKFARNALLWSSLAEVWQELAKRRKSKIRMCYKALGKPET